MTMFCHQCGRNMTKESKFCPHCGAKNSAKGAGRPEAKGNAQKKGLLPILLPVVSLVLISSGLGSYYYYETKTNKEVLQLQASAEELALNGDYEKSKQQIQQALLKRPDFAIFTMNLNAIEKAIDLNDRLAMVSDHIQKTEFDPASKELQYIKEQIDDEESPLFETFHTEAQDKEASIKIGMIKKELNDLTSVDELGGKLSILASLSDVEAHAVKEEILNKIVQISTDEAEKRLANRQFSDAFSTIDHGLQFAVNNEKLLALKDRVEKDQSAFEVAQQQRIEQAMKAAAQEDLKNRTAAAEVADFSIELDEYGDLYVNGTVKNVATANIYSVTIHYRFFDENGDSLGTGSSSLYPYYLQPGETGTFDDTYYGVHQNVTAEVENLTWYLE